MTDVRLLSELRDLEHSRVLEHYQEQREKVIEEIKGSGTDRQAALAIGRLQCLDERIKEIVTAQEQYEVLQKKQQDIKVAPRAGRF